jgi:hypothetical protein
MTKERTFLLAVLGFVAFAFTVPIVPLSHSCPANGCDLSEPLAFHGSLSTPAFQIGVAVDGIGRVGFHYVEPSNVIPVLIFAMLPVIWALRKNIIKKEEYPLS